MAKIKNQILINDEQKYLLKNVKKKKTNKQRYFDNFKINKKTFLKFAKLV